MVLFSCLFCKMLCDVKCCDASACAEELQRGCRSRICCCSDSAVLCVYLSQTGIGPIKKPLRQSTGIHKVGGINILYLS